MTCVVTLFAFRVPTSVTVLATVAVVMVAMSVRNGGDQNMKHLLLV